MGSDLLDLQHPEPSHLGKGGPGLLVRLLYFHTVEAPLDKSRAIVSHLQMPLFEMES